MWRGIGKSVCVGMVEGRGYDVVEGKPYIASSEEI